MRWLCMWEPWRGAIFACRVRPPSCKHRPPCPARRHTEALRIFVHRLKQLPLAEAYCDRVYQRRQQQLREVRHAELSAALRRQRSQRDATAAAAASGGYAAARPAATAAAGSNGSARSLHFSGSAGGGGVPAAAGAPATKLQAPPGSSSAEDGADIYLLLVQASSPQGCSRAWPSC